MTTHPTPWIVEVIGKLSYVLDARRETICLIADPETAARIVRAVNEAPKLRAKLGESECVVCGEPGMGPLCDYHAVVVNNLDGRAHTPTPTPAGEAVTREQLLNALRRIDRIVSDDFCVDLEMRCHLDPAAPALTAEETRLVERKIAAIYRAAHSLIPEHSCYGVHGDWRAKATADGSDNV